MKIKPQIIGLLLFLLLLPFVLHAQKQKIGYVNTDIIIQKMQVYENAKQQLKELSSGWKNKLEQMKKEISRLKRSLEAKKALYSKKVLKQKRSYIQKRVAQRREFINKIFGPKGEYVKAQKRLFKPIQQKIYKAIIAVSERMNIDFVFDRAKNTSLLYAREKWNLNKEILTELGITLNQ